jgi:transposase-like protein
MIEHAVEVSPPVRRRHWSDAIKARIVAESFALGAVVWEVARRHGLSPQHLSAWRKAARSGLLKLPNGTRPAATRPSGTSAAQDISASSRLAPGVFGGPGPRHEFVQTRGRPEIDQLGENVGQVGLRLDAAELAGLDQRSDAGPILRALIMPREQRVFAIEDKRADASLDDVGVEFDAAVSRNRVSPSQWFKA